MATKASTNLSAAKAAAVAKPVATKPAASKPAPVSTTTAVTTALSGLTASLAALAGLVQSLGTTTSGGSTGTAGYRTDASYVAEGRSGTSNTGQHYIDGKLATDAEWAKFLGGGSSATTSASTSSTMDAATKDAFALLADTFKTYGLSELVPDIQNYMQNNIGPEEAKVLLKQTTAYKTRFAGNETRSKAGLNVLTEAEYLAMEDKYSALLKQYGQSGLATRSEFGTLIGADVSATELNSRLNMAVTRVQQADPNILASLKTYYPGVSDTDLVGYFLAPDKKLPELEQKVVTGEIAAAAQQYGLKAPTLAGAQELAGLGITQTEARTGYQSAAQVLPGAEKLSSIYKESGIGYDQTTAEAEFLKGTASAARKRQQLKELEQAAFGGQSGVGTQGVGSLGKSTSGAF